MKSLLEPGYTHQFCGLYLLLQTSPCHLQVFQAALLSARWRLNPWWSVHTHEDDTKGLADLLEFAASGWCVDSTV
jgi:hypothetical protein